MDDNKNPFKNEEEQELNEETETKEEVSNVADEEAESEETEEEASDIDSKYEELNNKYIRLAADFDNYRKRTAVEKEELSTYTTIQILKKITAVLDTFDRARESLADIDDPQKVKEGYDAVYKQLNDTLSKIGLVEMEAVGNPFNPSEHEAITQVPTTEFEPDTVALVAQKGYKLGDKVVRPALVGVAVNQD